ncbi:hypothetical protein BS50DRAFT_576575 [Corynespora cassiicola Philippines]|uniref:Mitochondrial export translocase Oxa2 n=1 Tax=Corynespora cassiicola Philippines TaxID=1448308 RepID=A0A2T2NES8_CORCC|nr:hypothetical protein BS50DRAFT_576575 [Corynespora cassiicola Philippines]
MLASRLTQPPARQVLARSTAAHARTPVRPPAARAFHATAPRRDALDAFLYLPHELLSVLHTGLPWYTAIPAGAFIVRGILVSTFGSSARALTARYIGTHPLRQAITKQKTDELMRKGNFKTPQQAKLTLKNSVKQEIKALDKRWNCTIWGQVSWTLLQLPLFFTMAETIRQMCSYQDGLLSMGLKAIGLKESSSHVVHGTELGPPNPWFAPDLADGGLLWFTDLLVPDPTGILPFAVSGIMFANIYFTNNTPGSQETRRGPMRHLRKVLLGVSLLIGPLCQEVPAALMYYWASSTTSVMIWNKWLDWRYPAPKDFVACSRPLHILPPPKQLGALPLSKTRRL